MIDEFMIDAQWIDKDPETKEIFIGKEFDDQVEWYRSDGTLDSITTIPNNYDRTAIKISEL